MRESLTSIMAAPIAAGIVDPAVQPRIIARSTVEYRRTNGATVIRFHATDIVVIEPCGIVRLDSGGWRTMTTRDRIERFSPVQIWSDRGVWTCKHRAADAAWPGVPFSDGIEFLPDGRVSARVAARAEERAKRDRALKREIKNFVHRHVTRSTDPLPLPSDGDCWYCAMFDAEKARNDRARAVPGGGSGDGAERRDASHILEHVQEGYLHGSLIVNAMRWAGYSDRGIGLIAYSFQPNRSTVARCLRRYIQARLGLSYK